MPARIAVRSILVPPLSASDRTARLSVVAEWKTLCSGLAPMPGVLTLGISKLVSARVMIFGSAA